MPVQVRRLIEVRAEAAGFPALKRAAATLSERYCEGKPTRLKPRLISGRKVDIWRFPDHPAGGQFGGHYAAITQSGPYLVVASIHGENADKSAQMAVALARKADAAR